MAATDQEVIRQFKKVNFAVSEYDATALVDLAANYGVSCVDLAQRYDVCAMNRCSQRMCTAS